MSAEMNAGADSIAEPGSAPEAAAAPPRKRLAGVMDGLFKFLLGDDIFLSYSRADGATYATALADELARRGFACRIDQWGTESGSEMPASLKRALRRSAALVLIGTRGAARSKHVAEEVRELKRRGRMVVPIVFEGVLLKHGFTPGNGLLVRAEVREGLQEATWADEIEGLPISCEKGDALTTGKVLPEALNRIEKTCTFWKRDKRLRISSAALACLLVLLIAASVWAGKMAARQTAEARKQQGIALGRQTANTADLRRVRSLRTEYGWAGELQESMLLALEADLRLSALGVTPGDAGQSLRESMSLLPRSVRKFEHQEEIADAVLADAGKLLITWEYDDHVRVWESAGHKLVAEIPTGNDAILSSDRTLLATVHKGGHLAVWRLPKGELLWKQDGLQEDGLLQISPDGRYILAEVAKRGVVVWHARNGKPFAEVRHRGSVEGVAISHSNGLLALSVTRPDNFLELWSIEGRVPRRLKQVKVAQKDTSWPLSMLTFSPNDELLAASTGHHASILQVSTGAEAVYIPGPDRDPTQEHGNNVEDMYGLEFSADGSRLRTLGHHGTVDTWDVATGMHLWGDSELGTRRDSWQQPYAASTMEGGGLRVLDLWTGDLVIRLFEDEDVEGVDYDRESSRLVLYGGKRVWLYDAGSAQEDARAWLQGDLRLGNSSSDRRYMALTSDKTVTVLDTLDARKVARLEHDSEVYYEVAFSLDGRYIATASWDNSLYVWNAHTGRRARVIPNVPFRALFDGEEGWTIKSLRLSPRGKYLVLETSLEGTDREEEEENRTLRIWEVSSGREILRAPMSGGWSPSGSTSFSSDESFAVIDGGDHLTLLDAATGTQRSLPLEESFDFSPSNKLVARSIHGAIQVSQIDGGPVSYEVRSGGKDPNFDFSPDGRVLVIAGDRGQILEATTGRSIASLDFGSRAESIKFSPRSKYLVTTHEAGHKQKSLDVWELNSGRRVAHVAGDGSIHETVFDPEEKRLAVVVSDSPTVRVLDLNGKAKEAELFHEGSVDAVRFSADGRFLAVMRGEWAHAWEMGSWREIARLRHDGDVILASVVAGGSRLATVSEDLTARVWVLPERDLVARACRSLTRNLGTEEWKRSFGAEPYRRTCPNLPLPDA